MPDGDRLGPGSSASRPRNTKPSTRVFGTERRVRHYQISSVEMLGLSVFNPLGALFIGLGVDVYKTWLGMPVATPEQVDLRDTAWDMAMLGIWGGGAIVLITWGAFMVIWFQSDPDDGPSVFKRCWTRLFG